MLVTDNQGDWLGTSKAYFVERDKFYGHPASLIWEKDWDGRNPLDVSVEELNALRTPAAVLFPQGIMANSPTQVLYDSTEGKFGPFAGQTLVGEMNKGRIMRLLLEEVDGKVQGAVVPLLDDSGLKKGVHRMTFGKDGALYVGHTHLAWAGSKGLDRIVWNGETPPDVLSMKRSPEGFHFRFTQPLDSKSVSAEAFSCDAYRFQYHSKYGSDQLDKHRVAPAEMKLSDDGLGVELKLPEIKEGFVYEYRLTTLRTKDGKPLANTLICYTNRE